VPGVAGRAAEAERRVPLLRQQGRLLGRAVTVTGDRPRIGELRRFLWVVRWTPGGGGQWRSCRACSVDDLMPYRVDQTAMGASGVLNS
jgi:hypothetical protein